MTGPAPRRSFAAAFLLFLLLPAVLLGECAFGGKAYLPFDPAEFPPVADALTPDQRRALRATANYDATEAPIWFAVELQLAREALQRGQLPHWNPYVRTGAPMLAHGHLGLLNPLHWPALAFADPADGLCCLTWIMLGLAGALMFGLLQALGLSPLAAAFGGVAFAWSGTLTANGHWFMRLEPLALAPGAWWAMLAVARRSGRARLWPAAGLAAAMAGIWLSGFPQYGIPVTLLCACLGAVLCLRELRHGLRAAMALGGWLLLGSGLGVLLAMPQLLPMLQFYPLSNRPIDEALDRAARHQFAPMGWLGYLLPAPFSHPGDQTLPTEASPLPWLWSDLRHWQTGAQLLPNYNFTEYALFPGTVPLACALLALLWRGPRWRWLAVAGLGLVWVLATGAGGAHAAYLLPGLKTVPPYRFAGPACALVALLAAAGFDALRRDAAPWLLRGAAVVLAAAGSYCLAESTHAVPPTAPATDPWLGRIVDRYRDAYAAQFGVPAAEITPAAAHRARFVTGDREDPAVRYDAIQRGRERLHDNLHYAGLAWLLTAAGLFACSLRGGRRGLAGWPAWLALAATAAELAAHGLPLNRGQAQPHAETSAVHEFLRQQRDAARDAGGFVVGRATGDYGIWNLPGGLLAKEHIRDLNFYTFVDKWGDLPIRRLYGDQQILRGFVCDALPDDERLRLPYWDLLGLRYVLSTRPLQHAGELRLQHTPPGGSPPRTAYVYERTSALPRAFVVPALVVVDDQEQLLARLCAPDFAPRQQALVGSADAALLPQLPPPPLGTPPREIAFTYEDTGNLVLEVGAGAPGYLVVDDTCFPGWTAEVGGAPAPIARANLWQRLVALPAGAVRVHFRYRALGYHAGLALGAVAAALLLALLWCGRPAARTAAAP